ncbi:MAG: Rrf2 family transcriptional regulator [candidate division Zixibacteria bacterium]|nr:Rrf2 family transcriptional regulator [candidate division Zixibacteria bacterium]
MRITKQEEYGLRCVLQLALSSSKPVTTEEIAGKEGLSVEYVTKLLIMLRKAGLVNSLRGVKGGYLLAREPEKITIGQVMRALGWAFLDESMCEHYPGKLDLCIHLNGCGIRPIWIAASKMVYQLLDSTTLAHLLKDEKNVVEDISVKFANSLERR